MAEFTQDALTFARGLARWFLRHGWIHIHEYRSLSAKIALKESAVFGCEGKNGFVSYRLAEMVVKRSRTARGGHKRSTVYHCNVCHLYHVAIIEHSRAVRLRDGRQLDALASFDEDFADA